MGWIAAGVVYSAAYAAAVALLRGSPELRLWVGNLGLLLSPLVAVFVILRRRHEWRGHHLAFWDAVAAGSALWFAGQVAWASYELLLHEPQPWLNWVIVPQLCGSTMPLLALIAAPHRGQRRYTATTAALDIYGVMSLVGFLFWVLIIAPGMAPGGGQLGLKIVSFVGPAIRAAACIGLAAAAFVAAKTPWAAVYKRLAVGVGLGLVFLLGVSAHVFTGDYVTGSIADIGWILPYWFFAAAAATSPASDAEPRPSIVHYERPGPPLLLFGAIVIIPIVTMLTRHLMPLGPRLDHLREGVEDLAILAGITLVIIRSAVELRVVRRYERRIRLLAAACEQTSELIVITHGERVEYANEAFRRALGYTRSEITSLDRGAFFAGEPPVALTGVGSIVSTGGALSLTRRDGTTFPAAIASAPLDELDGFAHVVTVVRDLSDDIRLREQLVQHERLSAVGELVSSIAHQLNNPLQSVVGTVDVLLSAPAADSLKPDLERVRLEAWRAGHIIRNLLAFARKSPGERLLGELNEVVQGTLKLCAYELESTHVRVVTDLAPDLPLVLVNREEIQQAVINLVSNAQQSLAQKADGGTLVVRTYLRNGDAILEVADDGHGVPPELVSRIFEPFVTTKSITEANGFGLSTAFGIVAAHGGTLELVPVAVGACFRVTLPGAGFAGPVVHSA